MKFTTTKNEPTVSALAARVFGVGSRTAVARRAKDALVDANPALADIKALPAGTPIAVPAIDEAQPVEELASLHDLAARAAIDETRLRVRSLSSLVKAVLSDRTRDLDQRGRTIAGIRHEIVDDELGQALERVRELDSETRVELGALSAARDTAFSDLDEDLDALRSVLTDA